MPNVNRNNRNRKPKPEISSTPTSYYYYYELADDDEEEEEEITSSGNKEYEYDIVEYEIVYDDDEDDEASELKNQIKQKYINDKDINETEVQTEVLTEVRTEFIPFQESNNTNDVQTITNERNLFGNTILIAGPILAVVFIFFLIFFIYIYKRRHSRKLSSTKNIQTVSLERGLLLPQKFTFNQEYFECILPDIRKLAKDQITFIDDVGEGHFGKVFKGELSDNRGGKTVVAVKVLKESAAPQEAKDNFVKEIKIMSSFNHENILTLIGIVVEDLSPWIVFEYMLYGDLAQLLRSQFQQISTDDSSISELSLSEDNLYKIVLQIASGMNYLAEQKFVHRDLACRNCLVSSNLTIKIADFGMTRDVYLKDYYQADGSRSLPVRWMPPESIAYGRFTFKSDVWSFGIVLWEIYSHGKLPYCGFTNEEVIELILRNITPIPPEDCPIFIKNIMQQCWDTNPENRLKFSQIYQKLEQADQSTENQS